VTTGRIHPLPDDLDALESLYRQDPESFRRSLEAASRADPDSLVLRVWRARLGYRKPDDRLVQLRGLASAIGIALICGALVRLPALVLGEDWYYPRFAPSLVILALSAYFWIRSRERRLLGAGLGLALAAAAYVSVLPGYTDSVVMALIHLPIVFWAFLGLVFTGDSWRDTDSRVLFVRYNGELLILASLVALGGMVFSGITVALFDLVAGDVEELYFKNVGVFGAAAVPVAGTYLYDSVFNRRTGIPAVLARVFAPLFLVMATTYLIVAFLGGQNPFVDRSFLITFNGLLLVVLGITVLSIVERDKGAPTGPIDYINIALAAVTLLIDAIALAAILFRLASFGFTPNRVTVLGANLIIMVHLARMCWTYLRVARGRAGFTDIRRVVTSYLPVYIAWAAVVAFLLPLVFRFS
jgi:hypothetical protein